jgi:hypothetical protein
MRAFFSEKNQKKADEIAARQFQALRQHDTGKLRLTEVGETFDLRNCQALTGFRDQTERASFSLMNLGKTLPPQEASV